MAEPRQPLGIRKEVTGVICGSPTPLWRFPAETYKRGSSSIDPEILAWLRPAKLKRRKIKPAAVDQSWEAVERAVQMRLNNLAKTPRRPPMMMRLRMKMKMRMKMRVKMRMKMKTRMKMRIRIKMKRFFDFEKDFSSLCVR